MMPCLVLPSRPCQHVRVLAINRPEKRNALSQELIDRFLQELGDASRDESVRVIVVTGTDTLFCGMAPPLRPPSPPGVLPMSRYSTKIDKPADITRPNLA
jgi:hypothetical protein